jgi:hypothetical protein
MHHDCVPTLIGKIFSLNLIVNSRTGKIFETKAAVPESVRSVEVDDHPVRVLGHVEELLFFRNFFVPGVDLMNYFRP